ncbi:transcriptional regulator, TetR family [Paenibacillus curdlanolyticus YK9]|uniref:Transcriptional regulator, TetR family n=1 Tax=Paenibacillus curdlanolyticus YK9 TaxID=717606 RepID=E0I7Y7_9BACL|nr:TetR/AcrR family transcriptional regulator [Paenibacillus curdlanolyticus]EFM11292.1 transcriptional regulator, TetR family [Paenibacillus curdlanolyticus YK9]
MLRASRKQALKDQIYEEALNLFRIKGFNQVTVEEITQACGIAKGTFYNYFPRKESILLYLSELQMAAAGEQLTASRSSEDPKTALLGLFDVLMSRYTSDRELVRIMMMEMIRSEPAMAEELRVMDRFQGMIAQQLEAARTGGKLLSSLDCANAAAVISGVYFQTLMAWASSTHDAFDMRKRFKDRFELVWHGIHPTEQQGG